MVSNPSDLHGPTQLDLNPKPPNSVRLSKRAGFLALGVLGIVAACVLYGIVTRGDRQFKLGFHPDEARNVTAATDVGKTIASKIPARPASAGREPAEKPEKETDELTAPPLRYQSARQPAPMIIQSASAPVVPPAQPSQPTAEERRKELAWQREQEAMEASTAAREGY